MLQWTMHPSILMDYIIWFRIVAMRDFCKENKEWTIKRVQSHHPVKEDVPCVIHNCLLTFSQSVH